MITAEQTFGRGWSESVFARLGGWRGDEGGDIVLDEVPPLLVGGVGEFPEVGVFVHTI